jgi:hypothetical protein
MFILVAFLVQFVASQGYFIRIGEHLEYSNAGYSRKKNLRYFQLSYKKFTLHRDEMTALKRT